MHLGDITRSWLDNFCRLIEKLKVIGVKTQEDLPLVEQADISDVLTPIEVRKLIKAWNQG